MLFACLFLRSCSFLWEQKAGINLLRMTKCVQISQLFPLNIANTSTLHKLQGQSLNNLLVSNWSYTPNWIYVVLSRIKTSKGLVVRKPLLYRVLTGLGGARSDIVLSSVRAIEQKKNIFRSYSDL